MDNFDLKKYLAEGKLTREMKTPIQELIEQLKEEKDLHGYEGGLHYEVAIELAESMLEKEEDYRKRMREIVAQELHNLGMPTDRIKGVLNSL